MAKSEIGSIETHLPTNCRFVSLATSWQIQLLYYCLNIYEFSAAHNAWREFILGLFNNKTHTHTHINNYGQLMSAREESTKYSAVTQIPDKCGELAGGIS